MIPPRAEAAVRMSPPVEPGASFDNPMSGTLLGARLDRGLTREDVAEGAGLPVSEVGRLETTMSTGE
jgi:hypothetical protein